MQYLNIYTKILHDQQFWKEQSIAVIEFEGVIYNRRLDNPTYVALNPNQGSIEYIKEYKINNDFVLVAVRISNNGTMFAKTLFTMTERKKNIYLKNGYAKKYQ